MLIDFRDWGKGGRAREGRNTDVREKLQSVASYMPQLGDRAHNLGMCLDGESNL